MAALVSMQCLRAIQDLQARLKWYQVYSHILTLNVSEKTRDMAKAQASKQCGAYQEQAGH